MRRLAPLAFLAVIALAACGSSSKTTSSTPPAASSTAATTSTTATTPTTATTTTTATTPSSSAGGKMSLALEASPQGELKYSTDSLTTGAGTVTIAFTNKAPLAHNLTVESSTGKILGATPTFMGGTKTLTLTLAAGTYKYFCSVPGHRQAGMEGTLTVH